MSRAEERAMEAYPLNMEYRPERDLNEDARAFFQEGYEAAQKDLGWKSVDEELPPMDEEVIVLRSFVSAGGIEYDGPYLISFGHIVDTERCIDYNGWNVPGVKFWMHNPELPKEK